MKIIQDFTSEKLDYQEFNCEKMNSNIFAVYPDTSFKMPKMFFNTYLYLSAEIVNNTASFCIFEMLLKEFLREFNYKASQAQIKSSISRTFYGLKIYVFGFSDGLQNFVEQFAQKIREFLTSENTHQFIESKFEIIKTKKKQDLDNMLRNKPYHQIWRLLYKIFRNSGFSYEKLKNEIDALDLETYMKFHKKVFSYGLLDQLTMGNISAKASEEMNNTFINNLQNKTSENNLKLLKPLNPLKIRQNRQILLDKNTISIYYEPLQSSKEENSSVCILFESPINPNSLYLNQLLEDYLHTEYFADIRTSKQVGYAVFARNLCINHINRFSFEVQSNKYLPSEIAIMTYKFLDSQKEKLAKLSNEKFEELKNGLVSKYKEEFKSLNSKGSYFLGAINDGTFNFSKRKDALEFLQGLNEKDFYDYFVKVFCSDRKVSEIHLLAQDKVNKNLENIKNRSGNNEGVEEYSYQNMETIVYDNYKTFISSHCISRDEKLAKRFKCLK